MRRFLICSFVVLIVFPPFAMAKKKEPLLPGMVPIKGNYLYISTTEVSNLEYREFLYSLKQSGQTELYLRCLPDTTVWRRKSGYNEPYVEYYFRHPAYEHYPVVGVDYDQVTQYCQWLSKLQSERVGATESPIKAVEYRLPSRAEWELAARGTLDSHAIYPWQGESLRANKGKDAGKILANFVRIKGDLTGVAGSLNDNADITAPVNSYWPNTIGLYCISGNVYEMLNEKGLVKGGSWRSPGYNLRIDIDPINIDPAKGYDDVGFRLVAEIVEMKVPFARNKDIEVSASFIEEISAPAGDSIFACRYEVSNRLYRKFLSDKNVKVDDDNRGLYPDDSKWVDFYGYAWFGYYSEHPDFDDYPVVNIEYSSAIDFCDWLTDLYNSDPKRKYTKVKICLPDSEEWEYAARGGLRESLYPWGGYYTLNYKGCFVCNYAPGEERFEKYDTTAHVMYYDNPGSDTLYSRAIDGWSETAPVQTMEPNGYGLYNMAGNVAEMISRKGVSKGGSWGSNDKGIAIHSKESYSDPNIFTGFRFFMKIEK